MPPSASAKPPTQTTHWVPKRFSRSEKSGRDDSVRGGAASGGGGSDGGSSGGCPVPSMAPARGIGSSRNRSGMASTPTIDGGSTGVGGGGATGGSVTVASRNEGSG